MITYIKLDCFTTTIFTYKTKSRRRLEITVTEDYKREVHKENTMKQNVLECTIDDWSRTQYCNLGRRVLYSSGHGGIIGFRTKLV